MIDEYSVYLLVVSISSFVFVLAIVVGNKAVLQGSGANFRREPALAVGLVTGYAVALGVGGIGLLYALTHPFTVETSHPLTVAICAMAAVMALFAIIMLITSIISVARAFSAARSAERDRVPRRKR